LPCPQGDIIFVPNLVSGTWRRLQEIRGMCVVGWYLQDE
jgi:hypothetical protein